MLSFKLIVIYNLGITNMLFANIYIYGYQDLCKSYILIT